MFVLASIVTAVAEEVVVLGYLVRRLEQRGWRPAQVVAVAAAVRISYHLYYGIGVLPIAVWAVLSVVLYRTYRRLPAFIVVHAVWDATLFARVFVGGGVVPLVALLVGIPSIVVWGVERQRRAAEQRVATGMPYPLASYPGAAQPPAGSPQAPPPLSPPAGAPAPWTTPAPPPGPSSPATPGSSPPTPGSSPATPGSSQTPPQAPPPSPPPLPPPA